MKKILVIAIFFLSYNSVNADCMYEETDPVCSITGETFTSSCAGWSDTSSWSLPKAYDSTCNDPGILSQDEASKVYNLMMNFIGKNNFGNPLYGDGFSLNKEGQEFMQNKFFPKVAEFIAKENAKINPNTKVIAILNEAVKMIGYDYYIKVKVIQN